MSVFDVSALVLAVLFVSWMTVLLTLLVRLAEKVGDLRARLEASEVGADEELARSVETPLGGCGGVKASE